MKLFKPTWVTHDEKPIFSVDIHPAGKRFATGGQGGDSGRVVIWNLNSILDENVELDPAVPKMLCQMDNHLACVNCVRWSNNGRYLASGGDDKLVMVWQLSGAPGSAVFGSNGKHNVESWRCVSTLRGHAGDILDLAWSPLDKWLASCSVDNTIIIWNAEKFPEMVCVLNGHTGLVKGVAWDPVGKYLASQSDDKSLRIWKTADWAQESIITEPFEECGGTTHVLRLSWSPDGQYVVSAHAMNGGGPTAQVVERSGWRYDKDFVGHRKAVTCARFNNNILVKEGKRYCCCAVGSRDRALSIWLTSLKRPLVVVHELFTDSVLDLSWSSDGLNLVACSWDGTVACIQFTNKEIGTPLTLAEKNALYERTYGKCLATETSTDLTANLLVECPEILLAREKTAQETDKKDKDRKEETPPKSKQNIPPVLTPSPGGGVSNSSIQTPVRPIDRQIETRTSDGKRRITPVFIPTNNAQQQHSDSMCSAGVADGCFSSSSQSKSRIRVERRDDIVIHPNVSNHAVSVPGAPNTPTTFTNVTPQSTQENGLDVRLRKRSGGSLPGPRTEEVAGKRRCGNAANAPAAPPAPHLPPLGAAGPVVRTAGHHRVQLLNNACTTAHGKLSRIQLLPNNSASCDPVWETYLGSNVNCISCDARYLCVSCDDGTLHSWYLKGGFGTRALPPLALGAPALKLALTGDTLAAVTSHAKLLAWDLASAQTCLQPIDFRSLLGTNVSVSNLTLLEDGSPAISLSNGKGYVYSQKLSTWVVWVDPTDPVYRAARGAAPWRSGLAGPAPPPPPQSPHHALARTRETYSGGATAAWLEAQVAASLHLQLTRDYKHWMLTLLAHLSTHGKEEQLRPILDDLLGPSHCTSTPARWKSDILGIKKHELLEQCLGMLVKQLRWQRLYVEYNDQLNTIKETEMNVES